MGRRFAGEYGSGCDRSSGHSKLTPWSFCLHDMIHHRIKIMFVPNVMLDQVISGARHSYDRCSEVV